MKMPRARLARETDLVFRIAYCVPTERNTKYAIRTVVNTANVGLVSFQLLTVILFSKQEKSFYRLFGLHWWTVARANKPTHPRRHMRGKAASSGDCSNQAMRR